MKKFAVFSGFLGSGKTTTMMALTRYYTEHYAKAAMISNDLSHGLVLADHRLAELSGCHASDMTEDCICYQNEALADRLNAYYSDGYELVISDIPGFGVGALEHVYHGLTQKYPGQYDLAPFTVLVEPRTVKLLRDGCSDDMRYLYNTQLLEADLILLNKCDLLSEKETRDALEWLSQEYPEAHCMAISAQMGTGMDELACYLREEKASMHKPDIGYEGEAFTSAMNLVHEYYHQYAAVVCCENFDGNAYLLELAQSIQDQLKEHILELPHMKVLAWNTEGEYGKVDTIGWDRPIEVNHRFEQPCTQIAVVINLSAMSVNNVFDAILPAASAQVSEKYQLEQMMIQNNGF